MLRIIIFKIPFLELLRRVFKIDVEDLAGPCRPHKWSDLTAAEYASAI